MSINVEDNSPITLKMTYEMPKQVKYKTAF